MTRKMLAGLLALPLLLAGALLPSGAGAQAPSYPACLSFGAGNTQLTLSWCLPTNTGGSAITGYRLVWGETDGPSSNIIRNWTYTPTGSTDRTYTLTGLTNGKRYGVRVQAGNDSGYGGLSTVRHINLASAAPLAPTGVSATAGAASAALSWSYSDISGSAITKWQYGKKEKAAGQSGFGNWGAWTDACVTSSDSSCPAKRNYTVSGLTNGSTYKFRVRAVNALGDGAESAESLSVTPETTPAAPIGLTVSGGNGTAALSWTAGSNGGSAITGWKYTKHSNGSWDGSWTAIPNSGASTTSYTVPNLTNGTPYKFKVLAVNANGDGAESAESASVTPVAPTLTASKVEDDTATLTIANHAGDWYYKYTSPDGGSCSANAVTGTTLDLDNLSAATSYTFRAYSDSGCSTELAAASAFLTKPGRVSGLTLAAHPQKIDVSWTAQTGTVTGYKVQWKNSTQNWDTTNRQKQVTPGTATSTSITGLTNAEEYAVRVTAYNGTGDGKPSAESEATPAAVTLNASDVEDDTATLTIANHVAAWWYKGSDSGSTCTSVTAGIKTASLTNLATATSHTFKAYSDSNCSTELAAAGAFLTKPGQVSGVTVTGLHKSLDVSWDAQTGALTGYKVQWKSGPQDWDTGSRQRTATGTEDTIPNLTNGTQYAVRVIAHNATGDGEASDAATGTTATGTSQPPVTPPSETVPPAPGKPAVEAGNGQVKLTWTSNGDGGSAILRWEYVASTDKYGSWSVLSAKRDGHRLAATVAGLANGTAYRFRVRAVNANGPGAASSESDAVTPAAAAGADRRARLARLNEALAPEAARAMASSAALAVSARIGRLASGRATPALSARSFTGLLERHGEALSEGTVSLREALGGASVSLPLAAAEGGAGGGPEFWASGDWRSLSGGESLGWDGEMAALHMGADMAPGPGLLAGMALSVSEAAFEYTDRSGKASVRGEWTARMTGLHPYGARLWDDGSSLWAMAGLSTGEVEIDDAAAGRQKADSALSSLAAGGSLRLSPASADAPAFDLKGEALAARFEVDDNGGLVEAVDARVHRLRVAVAGKAATEVGPGAVLTPSAELALRWDGGDSETGLALEFGGGLSYALPAAGLALDARARTLLAHEGEREEWGASGGLRLDPDVRGRGPSFGLRLSAGAADGGAERLWEEGAAAFGEKGTALTDARLEAEGGYGLAAPGLLLTPWAGLGAADDGSRRYGAGLRLDYGPAASLSLEGARTESPGSRPGHDAMLKLEMRW